GAFIETFGSDALEEARAVDAARRNGAVGRMAGLGVSIKNSVAVAGRRLTCGSRMLEDYRAPFEATAVSRLRAAGGVLLGSTNIDEFCSGSDCSRSAICKTVNPVDHSRVPGGSSGGAAAATAAGLCDVALAEDTGGSIRCPASFCGVAGFKPTYGAVSRYGVVDMAMSFDQLGPIAPDVFGCALMLSAIAGEDAKDVTTAGAPAVDFTRGLDSLPKGIRVALPKQFFVGCDAGVEKLVRKAVAKLEAHGAVVEEVDFPIVSYALPIYYLLVFSEFASAMQKFDGLKYGFKANVDSNDLIDAVSEARRQAFGTEAKRRILLGTFITTKEHREAWYSKTLKARSLLKAEFARLFKEFDVVAGPTMPMVAWQCGEKSQDPLQMYLADVLTVPANCAGLPAGSVPCGSVGGLPVGVQLMAAWGSDALALKAMAAVES
ncbi:MAG: Asp-tRNA(Asn)/Glu-tRNA(Gln) amidotransferase subunit GatA, partial [Candidatus Micrarchaeota archaeon]